MIEIKKETHTEFKQDIIKGLSRKNKFISSKYFYDKVGDKIFQEIMNMPEYYLTRSEFEILNTQKDKILDSLDFNEEFDIIELGAGDGVKTKILLEYFYSKNLKFRYLPIDISGDVLFTLKEDIKKSLPIDVIPINMTYIDGYEEAIKLSSKPRLTIFLGSNIGNFKPKEAKAFMQSLIANADKSDEFFIGIDLKKDPIKILNAYNDAAKITSRFNLNILKRINREFNANFDVNNFTHFPVYNPESGSAKSFIVSKVEHEVAIKDLNLRVNFKEGEPIYTEISQKYFIEDFSNILKNSGFRIKEIFKDREGNFANILITT